MKVLSKKLTDKQIANLLTTWMKTNRIAAAQAQDKLNLKPLTYYRRMNGTTKWKFDEIQKMIAMGILPSKEEKV